MKFKGTIVCWALSRGNNRKGRLPLSSPPPSPTRTPSLPHLLQTSLLAYTYTLSALKLQRCLIQRAVRLYHDGSNAAQQLLRLEQYCQYYQRTMGKVGDARRARSFTRSQTLVHQRHTVLSENMLYNHTHPAKTTISSLFAHLRFDDS